MARCRAVVSVTVVRFNPRRCNFGSVAQRLRHPAVNRKIGGSSPPGTLLQADWVHTRTWLVLTATPSRVNLIGASRLCTATPAIFDSMVSVWLQARKTGFDSQKITSCQSLSRIKTPNGSCSIVGRIRDCLSRDRGSIPLATYRVVSVQQLLF